MGILTNFLKLLKPEPNDFVDVAKHISENYDKLDENAKSNNKTLTNLSNNKLDKGTYPGNASDLNTEIDGKVSKSGDTITGTLNINMEGKDKVVLKSKGTTDGVVGSDTDGVIVENSKSGKSIRLDNDGVGIYPSTSLKTEAKDLSGAVNELLDGKYKIEYKTIGSPTKELDILEFALTAVEGNYRSQADNNLITSLPEGIATKAFECRITSINKNGGYRAIELKPHNSNDVYINTQISFINAGYHPIWLGWNKLLNDRDRVILDKQDKGVLGGYNGVFPLTTAVKEGIYLLPATNKFYVCVENYSGSSLTAPNANFEELSVFQNRNKLENFFKILYDGAGIESFDISAYQQYNYFLVNVFTFKQDTYDGISTYLISRKSIEGNLDKFGFYMPARYYNYIGLKNNIIEKRSNPTGIIVQIKTILAFS